MVPQPRRPKSTTQYPEKLKYHTFIRICIVAWTGVNLAVYAKVEQKIVERFCTFFISLTTSAAKLKVTNAASHTWILQQFSCHYC